MESAFNLFGFLILDPDNVNIYHFKTFTLFLNMCVALCTQVLVPVDAQTKAPHPPRAAATWNVRCPTWVLGSELRSCERLVHVLNSEHPSGSFILFTLLQSC